MRLAKESQCSIVVSSECRRSRLIQYIPWVTATRHSCPKLHFLVEPTETETRKRSFCNEHENLLIERARTTNYEQLLGRLLGVCLALVRVCPVKLSSVGWGDTWMGDHLKNKRKRRHQTWLYSLESQASVIISASHFNNDYMWDEFQG